MTQDKKVAKSFTDKPEQAEEPSRPGEQTIKPRDPQKQPEDTSEYAVRKREFSRPLPGKAGKLDWKPGPPSWAEDEEPKERQ